MTRSIRRASGILGGLLLVAVVVGVAVGLAVDRADRRDPARSQVDVTCTNDAATDLGALKTGIRRSKPGDAVVIRGHCLVTGTVKLLGGRTYRGETRTTQNGVGSTIEQAPHASMPALLASDSWVESWDVAGEPIAIRDLSLRGNGGSTTSGIVLRSWSSLVDNVHVRGVGQDGIQVSNLGADGRTELTSTLVNGTISNSFIEFAGRHGIAAIEADGNGVTDWRLLNNAVASSGQDGIHLENSAGWMVSHNHVYGSQHNAILADHAWATTIDDNYVEDFGRTSQDATYCGIYLRLQGDASGSTITSNRVFSFNAAARDPGSAYHFIEVTGKYGDGAAVVNGNMVRSSEPAPNRSGLWFSVGTANSLDLVSAANLVTGFTAESRVVVGPHVTVQRGF